MAFIKTPERTSYRPKLSKCSSTPYLDFTAEHNLSNTNQQALSTLSSRIMLELEKERVKVVSRKRLSLCKVSDSTIWRKTEERRINYAKGVTFRPKINPNSRRIADQRLISPRKSVTKSQSECEYIQESARKSPSYKKDAELFKRVMERHHKHIVCTVCSPKVITKENFSKRIKHEILKRPPMKEPFESEKRREVVKKLNHYLAIRDQNSAPPKKRNSHSLP